MTTALAYRFRLTCLVLMVVPLLHGVGYAQMPTPTAQPAAKVPELEWFRGASGYERALELQKATGADIFVVFYREDIPDEKGLYRWLKTKGFETALVHNALRDYIKVKVELNKKAHEKLAVKEFNVKKTPATFVVWTNGWSKRCVFFDWSRKQPKLLAADKIVEELKKNSSSSAPAKE